MAHGLHVLHLGLVVLGVAHASSGLVRVRAAETSGAQKRLHRASRAPPQKRGVVGEEHGRAREEQHERGDYRWGQGWKQRA